MIGPITRDRFAVGFTREPSGCWLWRGGVNRWGYGYLNSEGKCRVAHRIAYELAVGPVPEGMDLDHLCRNRICVNPEHLEAVTRRENLMRSPLVRTAINAKKTECKRGHPLSGENLYIDPKRGHRRCVACTLAANRARYAARKALA